MMTALLLLAVQAAGHGMHADHAAHRDRQLQVAARGAAAMPFDLERTTHDFQSTPTGGVQTVTSDDGDAAQIALIRSHLRQVAAAFAEGDYSSPTAIHGRDMPGLRELSAGARSIRVSFEATKTGARLRLATADPRLVAAVHRWFAAQRSDHGSHAARP